jgi:hypothetical protein
MADLTLLSSSHNFTAGDLDTSGYVAVIPAFQKVYICDGNPWNTDIHISGMHKIDFINTRLVGAVTGTFSKGEVVTQATSGATGIFDEIVTVGAATWTLVYRTSTTEFDTLSHAVTGATSLATITPTSVVAPPHWLNWSTAPSTLTYDIEGTAGTGTDDTHLVDASLSTFYTTNNYIENWYVYVTGGTGTGSYAQITAYTASTGSCTVADWLKADGSAGGTDPISTSKYGIIQNLISTTGGTFPDGGSNIGCLCFGRIFLNSMLNPHQWFASRIFQPLDWDTGQTDVGAACTSQNAKAGEVGDAIVAMIPYKDSYLIWGCANQMWLLRSDPLQGGVNTCLSKSTGIFSPTSYCWDDKNNLYFLGTDGIYGLSSEAIINSQPPENLTKQRVPKLVTSLGLNRRTDRVTMAYDKQRYGIQISVTQQDGLWSVCWWLDLRTGGIFPDTFPTKQCQSSLFYFDSIKTSERALLLGGYDGFIRKYDETIKSDEGNNIINSWVTLGAFNNPNGEDTRQKVGINEISLTLGQSSDGVTVDVYSAKSADLLANNIISGATSALTKTVTGDSLKNSIVDKVSGVSTAIKISNNILGQSWSIEDTNVLLSSEGKEKK